MAGMVLGTVGAVVGGFFGGPMGAQVGWMLGSMVGNAIDPQNQGEDAPHLNDLKITSSAYGRHISYVWGTVRKAGDVLWALDRVPHAQHAQQGKGGGDGPVTGWTYSCTFAMGLCKGPIKGVRRIWANNKLVYDVSEGNTGFVGDIKFRMNFYSGNETQLPDPIMEQHLGVGNTPAYRGLAYIVFDDLDLSQFGSDGIPNFEFELVNSDESTVSHQSTYYEIEPTTNVYRKGVMYNTYNKYMYVATSFLDANGISRIKMMKIDPSSNLVIQKITTNIAVSANATTEGTEIIMLQDQFGNVVIPVSMPNSNNEQFLIFDAETLMYKWSITGETSSDYQRNGKRFLTDDNTTFWGFSFVNDHSGDWQVYKGMVYSFVPIKRIKGLKYNMADAYNFAMNKEKQELYFIAHDTVNNKTYVSKNELYGDFNQEWFQIPNPATGTLTATDLYYDYVSGSLFILTANGNTYGQSLVYKLNVDDLTYTTTLWNGVDLKPIQEQRVFMSNTNIQGAYSISYLKWDSMQSEDTQYSLTDSMGVSIGSKTGEYNPDNDYSVFFGTKNIAQINGMIATLNNELYTLQHASPVDEVAVAQVQAKISSLTNLLNTNNEVMFIHYGNRISDGSYYLKNIVRDISLHAGLTEDKIDVSDLDGIPVRGYATSNRTQARSLLQQLAPIFGFDAVESNRKIKFIKRGKDAVATIQYNELGAQDVGSSMNFDKALQITRMQELELPKIANIIYLDYLKDKQQNNQQSIRKTKDSQSTVTYEVPIVMTADEAKSAIERINYNTWSSREKFQFSTNYKYCYLEPTDIVNIVTKEKTYRVRITKKTEGNGVIKFEGESDIKTVYSQKGTGAVTSAVNSGVVAYSPSEITVLDMPIISESDNDVGAYFVVNRTNNSMKWQGAEIETSNARDGEYLALTQAKKEASIGYCLNRLGGYDETLNDMDSINYIDIFTYKTLNSITFDNLTNFSNLVVIGNEYVQFMTATPLGQNKYRLTNLLRGRFGTEQAINTHEDNERLTVFNYYDGTLNRFLKDSSFLHSTIYLKATTYGTLVSKSNPTEFYNTAKGLKPYAVCNVTHYRNNNDLNISWMKRVRGNALLKDLIDVNDLDADSYEIDIIKNGSVIRTIKTTNLNCVYTSAQQIEDFGSVQSSITVIIYKINSIIGRGFAKQLTI